MSTLLLCSYSAKAQCNSPAALSLVPPQTSTAFVLKWSPVVGATQYQIRYWETLAPDDKTIIDECGPSPFTLRGLRKNTAYTLQIRSKCGTSTSDWSSLISSATINSSGLCNSLPAGVLLSAGTSDISVSWASIGNHTIRYRRGDSGDWLIPPGASTVSAPPYLISGLLPGVYQVGMKRNCSANASTYITNSVTLGNPCPPPIVPVVTPFITSAVVVLPSAPGITGYNVEYRAGTTGNWIPGGHDIAPSMYNLNPPLLHSTSYQVRIQAICNTGLSGFSPPVAFVTAPETGVCLANKNAGKNLSEQGILAINKKCNAPSPFTFGSMIGVNDGGLVFRSFQSETINQITQLTTQLRNFHTMDEDFDASLESYEWNIKPKDTSPEGTPANTQYNKGLYSLYRKTHGFTSITGATELLQYAPQSWKEKMYKESDWSAAGPSGIMASYENYTKKFIDEFAPAQGTGTQILVSNFQVGNELWDYPFKEDYHSLLLGARNAFVSKYGPKSLGKWQMKLVVGAFQAYRDNTCNSEIRDFSNCNGALERHDFIGDYLEVVDCQLLKDLDAIDCHPYSFKPATTTWTYPEDPESETWQIRNMAAWLDANRDPSTNVLQNTQLWSTEYGFDSNPTTGVGEKTHAAYLLRGLMLHSRYHFEKIFFYNAFDVARPTDQYYNGLYNSAGFWKLGTHSMNSAWASPLEQHGATAKPAWYGMLDFKARFGGHVFHKVLVEDADAYVILFAKPDSTEPYLVFWSPKQTNDANIDQDIPLNRTINWSGAFAEGYTTDGTMAQNFAQSTQSGQAFEALTEPQCGSVKLGIIRRAPAFIRLVSCDACQNITNPGNIVLPVPNVSSSPFDPGPITNNVAASGGSDGTVEYQWQRSTDNNNFQNIAGATAADYDPPSLNQTTYFRRGAKRSLCTDYVYGTTVAIVISNACPKMTSFQRVAHGIQDCNANGDYFYEIVLNDATMNDQITLSGLPLNGINIPLCRLNGVALTTTTFLANLHYVANNALQWQVNASAGSTQTLRLYYCWAESYPNPVEVTTATSLCSGLTTPCVEGANATDPGSGNRGDGFSNQVEASLQFRVAPNPGSDHFLLTYLGAPASQASLRILAATGQEISTRHFSGLEHAQQWVIDTRDLPQGIYFLCLRTGKEVKWMTWEKS